jgi:hypothetical protein
MNMSAAATTATLCAGGLVAAESAVLLAGMNIPSISSWSTPKNLLLASSDDFLGSLLLYFSLSGKASRDTWLSWAASALLLITHVYREAEFLTGVSEPFTKGVPLFVFNNLRIVLLGLSCALILW